MLNRLKNRCAVALFSILFSILFAPPTLADDARWLQLKETYFGDKDIAESDDIIDMEAPSRAHDAATVPIKITTHNQDQAVRQLHLIVDMNPIPLAGIFNFSEEAVAWSALETRIRINEYTDIRAIAELEDGSLHMTTRFVKAAGGCSAPAMADLDAAMAKAGKMQVLLNSITDDNAIEGLSEATIKISHPNNSGMQFDQVSRNYIPAFYVNKIGAAYNGKELVVIETNFSMSENPTVRLAFNAEEDFEDLSVYAIDSKGNRYEKSAELEAATQ